MIRLRASSAMIARASVATVLLLSLLASSFETVWGLAQDGSVHHETMTEALVHASEGTGEHGHEAASEAPDEDHGPDHQHGTGADHCTHTHNPALLTPKAFALVDREVGMPPIAFQATPSDYRAPPLLHPPRT